MYLSLSERRQLDLLKKKSPVDRFLLMAQLIEEQIEAMKAGLRYRSPELNDRELEKCLKERMLEIYSFS
ncbi:MAG: hypothetical protein Q8R31_02875, partial [Candidatus Omnitrophota bacterium]|nr:hypothetical protein [Candidatus Omnitrophota bacterium]